LGGESFFVSEGASDLGQTAACCEEMRKERPSLLGDKSPLRALFLPQDGFKLLLSVHRCKVQEDRGTVRAARTGWFEGFEFFEFTSDEEG